MLFSIRGKTSSDIIERARKHMDEACIKYREDAEKLYNKRKATAESVYLDSMRKARESYEEELRFIEENSSRIMTNITNYALSVQDGDGHDVYSDSSDYDEYFDVEPEPMSNQLLKEETHDTSREAFDQLKINIGKLNTELTDCETKLDQFLDKETHGISNESLDQLTNEIIDCESNLDRILKEATHGISRGSFDQLKIDIGKFNNDLTTITTDI